MVYPHETNLDNKINSSVVGSKERREYTKLKKAYKAYASAMRAINFASKNIVDYTTAANLLNAYLFEVDEVVWKLSLRQNDKLRPTVLEELSVLLFENHPKITSKTMDIFNRGICAGIEIDKNLNFEVQTKDVDFCIGIETDIAVNKNSETAIIPFVCVEAKTYVDTTMNREILFSGTQLKNFSTDVRTLVLQEFIDEIGKNQPIPSLYNYAIDSRYRLRDCKRPNSKDPAVRRALITPIIPSYLLNYYSEIEQFI